MEKTQEITVTQMRKSVEKLGSATESCSDTTLMRFLIARSMDPEKAAKMFVQWQKWRSAFVPNGFIPDSDVLDELQTRKVFLQNLTKEGYPVLIVKGSKHFPAKDHLQFKKNGTNQYQIEEIRPTNKSLLPMVRNWEIYKGYGQLFKEFVVHFLDKTIASSFRGREIGNEKLIGILDLQQITYRNTDARGLITGFQFLQAYYPERLAKCFILHMPRFFVSVWRVVSRFLEKATQEKIVIVSNEEERENFMKEIGEEILPEEYGGQAKLVPIQDVVLPQLEG
ncbi:CRAL-TRIO domain-containing protein YKL091C isoform X1 [Jatropha curcas]|uniref:CRAL-TRIO domain-containing protein YKL091C isoform X1 n=1 Tax=Jatropha curcas TaxID=180498 RepID=UPI0005FAFBF5|nr:CRAL-TRIO domain-containing protein YKL091C isoform X1 [Jatropha curcas]